MIEELTVGIVFHNEEEKIFDCLTSLKYLLKFIPHVHLVLVDNGSTDQSVKQARQYLAENLISHEWVLRSLNHMGQARNDVLQRTKTRYLYFTDADCQLQEQTWPALMAEMKNTPAAAAWGGGCFFPQQTPFQKSFELMRRSPLGHFDSAQMMTGINVQDVDHLSTMHVLYDVVHVRNVGGFHAQLSEAAEDLELSLRLKDAGFKLIFVPTSMVLHHQFTTAFQWAKKAFRNAVWQTRLIAYNQDILKTRRPWPGLVILLLFPFWGALFFLYLIGLSVWILMQNNLNNSQRVGLLQVFLITHICYGFGEVYGIFGALLDKIKLHNDPSSTQT